MFGLFKENTELRKRLDAAEREIKALAARVDALNPVYIKTERALIMENLEAIAERVEEAATKVKQRDAANTRWEETRRLKSMQLEILKASLSGSPQQGIDSLPNQLPLPYPVGQQVPPSQSPQQSPNGSKPNVPGFR